MSASAIDIKRTELKRLQKMCIHQSKQYKKRYKKLKRTDDRLDVITTILNMSSISLTVSGFGIPPLLVASASCAGASLILSQTQKAYNTKVKLSTIGTTIIQYDNIAREIGAVLLRNHMSSKDYSEYIEDVNAKLSIIDDSRLI
jgi:hypothetical protein